MNFLRSFFASVLGTLTAIGFAFAILLFIFSVPNLVSGQVLYKEFIYDMPIDQAKEILFNFPQTEERDALALVIDYTAQRKK